MTAFQERVYAKLREVPAGHITTYKELAIAIGCGSSQAVGQALKRNPYAPDVPCHRVVASDGTLGGFCGQRTGKELTRKERLLAREGITVSEGKVVGFADKRHTFH